MRKRYGLTGPESGQGTVEYILVLVVVIIIILSLLYQFNSGFKAYAMAFFDGYISCLLETGELPGTGSTCQAEFAAYDPSSGKGYLKDNLPTGGGGGAGGGSDAKSGDKGKDAAKTSGADKANRSGGNEAVGGGGGTSYLGRIGNGGRPAQVDVGKVDADKPESSSENSGIPSGGSVRRSGDSARTQNVQSTFYMEAEEEKKEEKRPEKAPIGKAADNSGLRPAKMYENNGRALASSKEVEDKEFSISDFIRFMIILLIIVAMVIFFGGQLMQISKSREKGGE